MSAAPRLGNGETRVQVGLMLPPSLAELIRRMAKAQDRSASHVIERLLKSHPQISGIAATAGADVTKDGVTIFIPHAEATA